MSAPPVDIVLQALLHGLVDYAGLFPPAALDMDTAVAAYRRHLSCPESFMLGRFIVPAARLEAFAEALMRGQAAPPVQAWHVSVVATPADAAAIAAFNAQHAAWAVIDAVETRAASIDEVSHALTAFRPHFALFVELPVTGDLDGLLPALRADGACAKVRTGGLTEDAFPSSDALAAFMAACARHGVPFKATAGLHHAMRGLHPMNGQPDGAPAVMHGFLNVFLAAALLADGALQADACDLLDERDFEALGFGDETIFWQSHRITLDTVRRLRGSGALSFGSCSFDEPCDDLREKALL